MRLKGLVIGTALGALLWTGIVYIAVAVAGSVAR